MPKRIAPYGRRAAGSKIGSYVRGYSLTFGVPDVHACRQDVLFARVCHRPASTVSDDETHAPSWLMAAIIKTRKTRRWLFEQARRWWRRTVPSRLALHQGCPPPPTGMGRGGKTGWCFWGHARRCAGTRIPRRAPPSPPIKRGAAPAERSVNPPAQRKGQAERLTCYAGRMFCID